MQPPGYRPYRSPRHIRTLSAGNIRCSVPESTAVLLLPDCGHRQPPMPTQPTIAGAGPRPSAVDRLAGHRTRRTGKYGRPPRTLSQLANRAESAISLARGCMTALDRSLSGIGPSLKTTSEHADQRINMRIRDALNSRMCGRLGPCGVAAPRLSFAGCPGVDGAASGVQVNARQ